MAGQVTSEARRRYRLFVADGVAQAQGKRADLTSSGRRNSDQPDGSYDDRILGGVAFVETLRTRQELAPALATGIGLGELIGRVCDHFGVDPGTLQRKTRMAKIADIRGIVCYLAVRHLGLNGAGAGRQWLSRSGVSVAAGRGEQLLVIDPTLRELVN